MNLEGNRRVAKDIEVDTKIDEVQGRVDDFLDDMFEEKSVQDTKKIMGLERESKPLRRKSFSLDPISETDRMIAVESGLIPTSEIKTYFDTERIKDNIKYYKEHVIKNKMAVVKNLEQYLSICSHILTTVRQGNLPGRSYMIGAPEHYGKTSFVCECLITLNTRGYKVLPYISLDELYMLHEDVTGVLHSYYEYLNADCIFVLLSSELKKEPETLILENLLGIRGSKSLPTIVMTGHGLGVYERDKKLGPIWDKIKTDNILRGTYDELYHVSCFSSIKNRIEGRSEEFDDPSLGTIKTEQEDIKWV